MRKENETGYASVIAWMEREGEWVNLFIQGILSECWSHANT